MVGSSRTRGGKHLNNAFVHGFFASAMISARLNEVPSVSRALACHTTSQVERAATASLIAREPSALPGVQIKVAKPDATLP